MSPSDILILFGALASLVAAIVSSVLVYKSTSRGQDITLSDNQFGHLQSENASLRDENGKLRKDIYDLDNQRRSYYAENVRLLRHIERLRAWAYQLVRLLTNHGIHDLPPEPEEASQ